PRRQAARCIRDGLLHAGLPRLDVAQANLPALRARPKRPSELLVLVEAGKRAERLRDQLRLGLGDLAVVHAPLIPVPEPFEQRALAREVPVDRPFLYPRLGRDRRERQLREALVGRRPPRRIQDALARRLLLLAPERACVRGRPALRFHVSISDINVGRLSRSPEGDRSCPLLLVVHRTVRGDRLRPVVALDRLAASEAAGAAGMDEYRLIGLASSILVNAFWPALAVA